MGAMPGGLSTVKSKKFDDIKEEEVDEVIGELPSSKTKKNLAPNATEPMTP